ncbi:hypothetical protein H2248_010543 [Termitomyces sp. 'cryptogamus']|nr:hypothetical protein H2248_010543 [Termitomyces sp. 'cryptogamus']
MATPLSVTVRHLVNPSEAEVERILDVLQAAFGKDPFTNFLVGGDWSLVRPNFEFCVRAALLGGEVHIATLGPEVHDIIGVTVWYGPGQSPGSTEEQREVGSKVFFSKCPEELRKWWLEYFISQMERLADESLGPGFKESQWCLLLFGVVPEHQRKGVGKAMMKVGEERAKADGVSIVVETTTQVDLLIYKRMGFENKGQTTVESPQFGRASMYQLLKILNV